MGCVRCAIGGSAIGRPFQQQNQLTRSSGLTAHFVLGPAAAHNFREQPTFKDRDDGMTRQLRSLAAVGLFLAVFIRAGRQP